MLLATDLPRPMKLSILTLLAAFAWTFTACTPEWTPEERTAMTQSCIGAAQAAGEAWPKETCECLTQNLEKQYPNPDEMEALADSLQQNPVLLFDKFPDCRRRSFETAAEWTPEAENAFRSSCGRLVREGWLSDTAVCDCILDKVKRRFPTVQAMQRVDSVTMRSLAEECKGQRPARLY